LRTRLAGSFFLIPRRQAVASEPGCRDDAIVFTDVDFVSRDRAPDSARTRRRRLPDVVTVAVAVAISAVILLRYYDRMWVAGDEGYYGHIADRVLAGEVLHRDVQAMHPGYVYLLDALALRVFGRSLVSLRYPLVGLGVLQAAIIACFFLRRSRPAAVVAATLFTSLSYVLFPTPSVHWYCLGVLVFLIAALRWVPRDSPWRPLVVGFLVGVEGFLRQLTGVFVGVGAAAYLMAEPRPVAPDPAAVPAETRAPRLARGVTGAFAVLIGAYLLVKSSLLAAFLFGTGVPILLGAAAYRTSLDGRQTLRLLALLAAGCAFAAAPLLAYHLLTHSLGDWYRDSVVSALGLSDLEYVKIRRYAWILKQASVQVIRPKGLGLVANGAFWVALMLAPLAVALAAARAAVRAKTWVHPLPFLAVFYAPVAVHFEAPAYIFFATAPVAVGLYWFFADGRRGAVAAALAVALSAVALRYHAGPPGRHILGAVGGKRVALVPAGIPGVGLRIEPQDRETYVRLLEIIRRETSPGDPILAVPGAAELHFLSGRRNPTPCPYLVYGVMTESSLRKVLDDLRRDPPALVFHAPSMPYNTPNTDRVMAEVRSRYTLMARVREVDVYGRRPATAPQAPGPLDPGAGR
jgi:hypothetical protein